MEMLNALVLNAAPAVAEKPVPAAAPPDNGLRHFTCNLKGVKPRHDTMEGRPYLVVPMVMITSGVHNGSNGPLLYPDDEVEKIPETWNHKPVVVYHPKINGQGVSACDPTILSSQKVGVIMNTKATKAKNDKGVDVIKLNAEAWLEEERVKTVDNRILDALEKNQVMEVSTGLFLENDATKGTWNGEDYQAVARNYKPDHLAILPDQKGACSIADGAGLARNEASFDSIRGLLHAALREEYADTYCYVADIFARFFIYEKAGKLWKQNYTSTDTSATLSGEPSEVVRVVQYRSPDGTVVANIERNLDMNKELLVNGLIANGHGVWSESDRAFLMSKSVAQLEKLSAPATKPEGNKVTTPPAAPIVPATENKTLVLPTANATPVETKKEATVEEYIAAAPRAIRGMIANGLRVHEQEKTKLVAAITANTRNKFTPEQLAAKDLDELQNICSLMGSAPGSASPQRNADLSYAGLADAYLPLPAGTTSNEAPLALPDFAFEKK